jgi:pimeloyl-ACP methyl ester carboxylesterase
VAASVLVAPTPFNGLPLGTVAALARRLPWAAFKTFVLGHPAALTKAKVVQELCFSEQSPDAVVQRYVDRLVPEGPRVVRQLALMRLRPPGVRRVNARRLRMTQKGRPHLIVASGADRFVTPAGLEPTARLLGAEMLKLEGVPHAVVESDEDRSIVCQVMAWVEARLQAAERAESPSASVP